MSYCPNCKSRLTCGCQKRTSKNGVAGCTSCIAKLNIAPAKTTAVPKPNAPTNTKATYKGPGTQI